MAQTKTVIAALLILVVAVAAGYAGLTYPRTIVTIPVSFTIGADTTNVAFDQPALHSKIQVQVSVDGVALWRARILNGDTVVWEHGASQSDQQSYNSGWLDLPSGKYAFTFAVVGGALDATVTVSSKGGFW